MTNPPKELELAEIEAIVNQQISRLLGALLPSAQSQFDLTLQAMTELLPDKYDIGRLGGSVAAHFLASFTLSFASGAVGDEEDAISDDAMALVNCAVEIMLSSAPLKVEPATQLN